MDLVVATPVFLDLTFVGLDRLPVAGEERFAADLVQTPGGGAITAIAAARLGLRTAVAAPLGRDTAGIKVREALSAEGVEMVERSAARTPTTVVFPVQGDRAMVTVDPGVRAAASDVAALQPRAVALSLDQLYAVPDGAAAYVTVGDDDARAYAGRPPALLGRACVLFVNFREALGLTGLQSVESAAERLGETVETVVVTLGAEGAIAINGGERYVAPVLDPVEARRYDRRRRPARGRVHLGRPERRDAPGRAGVGRAVRQPRRRRRPPASAARSATRPCSPPATRTAWSRRPASPPALIPLGEAVRRRAVARQQQRTPTAATATADTVASATSSPTASPMPPITTVKAPPMPIESPIDSPAASAGALRR